MPLVRDRIGRMPTPWWASACVAAILLGTASESSAQTSSSIGGRILEIRGTRRVESGPAPANSNSAGSGDAAQSAPLPLLSASVPLSATLFPRNRSAVEPEYVAPEVRFTEYPASLVEDTSPSPLPSATSIPDERTAALVPPAELPSDSPIIATSSDATTEKGPQPTLREYPIVIQDHGSGSEAWLLKWVLVAISVVLGTFLLALLLLLLALRRLSGIQNSTIRIELADADSASLRLLANRLNLTGKASGDDAAPDSPRWFAGPTLSAPARPTRVADLADTPFPAGLTGPTFADARQAAEKRRLEQEEDILRNIYDRNLQLVEGLKELRARSAA